MDDGQKPNRTGGQRGLIGAIAVVGIAIAGGAFFLDGGLPLPTPDAEEPAEVAAVPRAGLEEGNLPRETAEADRPGAESRAPVKTGAVTFCLPEVIETPTGCAPAGDRRALGRASAALVETPLRLVSDGGGERDVTSCEGYLSLRGEGWYPLSTADMRREDRFQKACGLDALRRLVRGPGLEVPPLTTDLLQRIPPEDLPYLGEAPAEEAMRFTKERAEPPRWSARGEGVLGRFGLVSTANFDDDPEAEHLVSWGIRAEGGTLAASGFGLIDMRAQGPSFRTIDPLDGA